MNEIFKICHQYPKYSVSNYGRVRNNKSGQILKGGKRNGYLRHRLKSCDGSYKMVSVHRLVAEEFIDNPEGYDCIDHLDRVKDNNFVNNLKWCNHKMNNRNRSSTGLVDFTGISYSAYDNRYVASIVNDDDVRLTKSFSINKYGKKQALLLAKSQRRLWECQFKHYPIQDESGDEIMVNNF